MDNLHYIFSNPKILGSVVIGFALVFGAYTFSTFGQATRPMTNQQLTATNSTQERRPIAVVDENNNGIEDWRDEFVTAPPIVVQEQPVDTYTPPETVTGQMGIEFMEGIIRAKYQGPLVRRDQEQVLEDVAEMAEATTRYKIYDTPDITITETNDSTVRAYGNGAANAAINNDIKGTEQVLFILEDIAVRGKTERVEELTAVSNAFGAMRDDMIALEVPDIVVKEHLDLINAYHAMHKNIEAMTTFDSDPAVGLANLKRFQDDSQGLYLTLRNIYYALEPYASVFSQNDPAVVFVLFSPDFQGP